MLSTKIYAYNEYLTHKYGAKTYKCPINIPSTCPNRDGTLGHHGCSFCSAKGTGFESHHNMVPIAEQINAARDKMIARYKAKKFIGYFQNYTNTYMPVETFISYVEQALECGLVGIDIATRPDTISDAYIDALKKIKAQYAINITFELGLQIANDSILNATHRGHSVQDYEQTAIKLKSHGFDICTHLILNLPDSTMTDVLNTAKLMNTVKTDVVKLHSLYIAKDSLYEKQFLEGKIHVGSVEDYVDRVIAFITHLNPDIALARLVSRIPKEDAVFSNWDASWWKIYNQIMDYLDTHKLSQGIYYQEDSYGKQSI